MKNFKYVWKKAQVINNNDPLKKGRVQVKILPEGQGWRDDLLPWALPYFGSGNTLESELKVPDIKSLIIVMLKDETETGIDWSNPVYLADEFIEGFFNYDLVIAKLNTITEKVDFVYPNLEFKLFKDGTITFHDRATGQTGTYHNTGTYIFIDSLGNVITNCSNGFKVYNETASLELTLTGDLKFDNGIVETNTKSDGTFEAKNFNSEFSFDVGGNVQASNLTCSLDLFASGIATLTNAVNTIELNLTDITMNNNLKVLP